MGGKKGNERTQETQTRKAKEQRAKSDRESEDNEWGSHKDTFGYVM